MEAGEGRRGRVGRTSSGGGEPVTPPDSAPPSPSTGGASKASAYETAASGGEYSGFLRNYINRTTAEIQKAIRGYEKQVAEHLDKIAHPEKYVECWCDKLPQEQAGLIKKWQKDIARNQKHADILKGLLESRR